MAVFLCPKCSAPCKRSHRFCPACGVELEGRGARGDTPRDGDDPFLGITVGGKFVLRKLLGSGGMGNVYLADQLRVGRTAAVKIMHRHLLGDERAAARFINEARAASQLNHPHSISVLDFGQTDSGILYIVMEYLRGRSLDRVLREEFPIPFARVATILSQILDAVEAAHTINIIHRDLKPENVFLESTVGADFVKVLDFGVAKLLEQDRPTNITTPGLVPGTPEYMSPEQARGAELDGRSDVYSLGVILYELLTATVPFKGSSALETMMSHVQDPPPPPSKRRPDRKIPQALDSIVLWALAKDPDQRIASAAQFRDLISGWAEVSGIWPSLQETSEQPITTKARVLAEFFSADELAVLDDELGEGEQAQVTDRPQPRMRAGAAERLEFGPLLGREEALAAVDQLLRPGGPPLLRLVAADGLGKSRLAGEAAHLAKRRNMRLIQCRVDPGWVPISLSPLQYVAARCLGLPVDGCRDAHSIERASRRLKLSAEDLPGLKELFGVGDPLPLHKPSERRRERAVAFRNLVQRCAARRPLLLIFEDVELFDQPSQELIAWLAAGEPARQLKLLITHAASFIQNWPGESDPLLLEPLDGEASRRLVQRMLEVSDPLFVDNVVSGSQGNPLFLQQRCLAEVHEGINDPPGGNLADLLAARVERLTQKERELLQWMAVFNEWVSGQTLLQVLEEGLDLELISGLAEKGYLRQVSGGYQLAHRMVALVVYSTIPAEVRRNLHYVVAQHLRAADAPVTTVAHHAHEADDGPRAMEAAELAGAWASRCMDFRAATGWYSKATDIMRREWGKGRVDSVVLDKKAVDLAHRMATALRETGDSLAARGILEETLSVAAGEARSRALLRLQLGRLHLDMGQIQQAIRHLKLARTDAQGPDEADLAVQVGLRLALAYGLLGQKDTARFLVAEAVKDEVVEGHRPRAGSWSTLLEAAGICVQIGLHQQARGLLLDGLQDAERSRSLPGKLRILLRLADVHRKAKEWQLAEMRISQALTQLRSHHVGDRTLEAKLLVGLGKIRRIQGKVEEGRALLEEALDLSWKIGYFEGINRAESEIEMLRFALPQ